MLFLKGALVNDVWKGYRGDRNFLRVLKLWILTTTTIEAFRRFWSLRKLSQIFLDDTYEQLQYQCIIIHLQTSRQKRIHKTLFNPHKNIQKKIFIIFYGIFMIYIQYLSVNSHLFWTYWIDILRFRVRTGTTRQKKKNFSTSSIIYAFHTNTKRKNKYIFVLDKLLTFMPIEEDKFF